ncbi:Wzz/FepE/Etk N-terminal domain-containing protein [Bailinhaonella thermotolerans]|nr:Wzz/FepE/Etk N-terminal domain-containing protein [Bailinhaonella thermotolerans]
MTFTPPAAEPPANACAALLRRRWPTVLALVLLGTGVAGAGLLALPPAYTAAAQVLVLSTGVQENNNLVTARQREPLNLDTEAQVAGSAVVASRAAELLRARRHEVSPTDLRESLAVSVPPNSAILLIEHTARRPGLAAAGAQAVAEAYLANRAHIARASVDAQIRALRQSIAEAGARLGRVTVALPRAKRGTARHVRLAQQRRLLTRQADALGAKLDGLTAVSITPGHVISPARPPVRPSFPNPPLFIGSGLILGLLAGLGLAALRDRGDTRVRSARDVERLLGVPVLLAIERGRPLSAAPFQELARALTDRMDPGDQVVLVTTAAPGHGGGVVAASLAAALGEAHDTVLICADPAAPTGVNLLRVPEGPGLAEILTRHSPAAETERRPPTPSTRLRVITAGLRTGELPAAIGTPEFPGLLERLRETARYVVVQAPALSHSVQTLARHADGALIVVEAGACDRAEAPRALPHLTRSGVRVHGAAVLPVQAAVAADPSVRLRPDSPPAAEPASPGPESRPAAEPASSGAWEPQPANARPDPS